MKKETKLIIWVILIATLFWFVGYWISPNDIDSKEVLRQELSWVVESISWLNLQLSGLKNERTELEKQQTELTNKGNEYRNEIEKLKFKKTWLEMSLGLSQEISQPVKSETAIEQVNKLITLTGN